MAWSTGRLTDLAGITVGRSVTIIAWIAGRALTHATTNHVWLTRRTAGLNPRNLIAPMSHRTSTLTHPGPRQNPVAEPPCSATSESDIRISIHAVGCSYSGGPTRSTPATCFPE
jgi:hypothetical protein